MEITQTETKIKQLSEFGQSVWLDNISRSIINNKELSRLIDLGVSGVTSNPTIFDKSISGSPDYDAKIRELKERSLSTFEIYDELTVKDIQDAADLFLPVFRQTKGFDGYVSLEVNPLLAHKTNETIKEAKRLHRKVNRPNVMFKIPATDNGFEAGKVLLSGGININFTLIFSLGQYIRTADTFINGATEFLKSGGDLRNISSVASVFVSRIDTVIDKLIGDKINNLRDETKKTELRNLRGSAAVANCGLIFAKSSEIFSQQEFLKLKEKGLRQQRVLWASTSTKDPVYSDIKYVTELIGKSTINTMPRPTIDAFMDHGTVKNVLAQDTKDAEHIIESLRNFDIDINQICAGLLKDGVTAFEKSFDSLLRAIELKAGTYHKT
ncbi:MAG: transaldolase [Candidatus Omnitrophica bacterium]|nr:transaldolase [Candidatus Omnitrophota bacterium]MDD5352131.1 transaldolase [Candidatus Omnitrophota bacterium]MDD5549729.1 transaldolase [Candidatus Omnitrophota bacterium]